MTLHTPPFLPATWPPVPRRSHAVVVTSSSRFVQSCTAFSLPRCVAVARLPRRARGMPRPRSRHRLTLMALQPHRPHHGSLSHTRTWSGRVSRSSGAGTAACPADRLPPRLAERCPAAPSLFLFLCSHRRVAPTCEPVGGHLSAITGACTFALPSYHQPNLHSYNGGLARCQFGIFPSACR